jgi:hypothetical protein
MTEEKCEHFITERGKCIACGELVANSRWTMEDLQKEFDKPDDFQRQYLTDLGNIPEIHRLAEQTWEEYDSRATANEEPNCPQRPRLQMIAGRLMRIPFQQIFKEVVGGAYNLALEFGYRGDYSKWCQLVKSYCPPSCPFDSKPS